MSQSSLRNYPSAPDMAPYFDPDVQAVALAVGVVGFIVALLIAIRMAVKGKTWLPLLLVVAATANCLLEPVVCALGHCIHSAQGDWVLFQNNERPIAVSLPFLYTGFFFFMWLGLYPRTVALSLTRGFIWKFYGGACVAAFIFEILQVRFNYWVYYDHQALWIWKGTCPLFWVFLNPACVIVAFTLIFKFRHRLDGWKQIAVVPLSVMGAFMGHLGAGFPFYSATNSSAGPLAVDLSGVASILLAILMVWLCITVLIEEQEIRKVGAEA